MVATPNVKVEIDSRQVEELISKMKELDPNSIKALRREMRTRLKPLGNQVANNVPSSSPFIGMDRNYYGKVQWAVPTARISVTPSKSAKRRGWAPLVTLIIENKEKLGFAYTEHAGARRKAKRPMSKKYKRRTDNVERSHRVTSQGDALIDKAKQASKYNYKAGHFAYGKFLSLQPQMIMIAQDVIDGVMKKFNVKNRVR